MDRRRSSGFGLPWAAYGLLLLVSCYQPDYVGARYRCDPALSGSDCPSGLACIESVCRPSFDQGQAPISHDMSMKLPDLGESPDLIRHVGCANSGIMLNDDSSKAIYACNGTFDNQAKQGSYKGLCASGFHVCGDDTIDGFRLTNFGIHTDRCQGGFYAIFAPAVFFTDKGKVKVDCPFPTDHLDAPALAGCGSEPPSMAVDNDCFLMKAVVPCGPADAGTPWNCQANLHDARHTSGSGGVVCCKDNS